MITIMDEAETFTKACPEVKSRLADLSIKWLQQTCHALESYPDPTAALTGMWNMMRLVCRCGTGDCLTVVRQMTQELICLLSSALPKMSPTPGTESADSEDSNLSLDIVADSFTGLLVDLFTMLPAGDRQELFATLYKVDPTPVDAKRSLEMVRYGYNDWQQWFLDGATEFSRTHSTTFFPSEPPMESFERQLEEASQRYGYSGRIRQPNARSTPQGDSERAEILQVCRTQCSVSTNHISFLRQLHKGLHEASAPLQFQMQLLTAQVSNCRQYDWARRAPGYLYYQSGHGYVDHKLDESLLASDDIGSVLQALKDMWRFSMSPESVVNLLESVQDQVSPQVSDVMCDILISVLDCEASLHLRIFQLISEISLKPQHILQAVNITSCSVFGKAQSSDECRTTFIQCAEAIGKSYNQHKASGVAEGILLKVRVKAVDLLHQARSIPVARSTHQLACSIGVDVQSVMHVVCDSGQDALADLLALVVMLPGHCLLQSLEKMIELCNYYFKDAPGGQSKPLQVPPFKETVKALLERRKDEIKTIVGTHGETGRGREFINDLKACFKFLEDEAAFTTFEQDLAPILQNADRRGYRQVYRQLPWGVAYDGDDDEEDLQQGALLRQVLALAGAQQMPYFW